MTTQTSDYNLPPVFYDLVSEHHAKEMTMPQRAWSGTFIFLRELLNPRAPQTSSWIGETIDGWIAIWSPGEETWLVTNRRVIRR